jgi:hypothetical protein
LLSIKSKEMLVLIDLAIIDRWGSGVPDQGSWF